MKKKNSKHENINLFFSAFLILAYIICGYFFAEFADSLGGDVAKAFVTAIIFVIFGLLVFYATRVGEGKAIKRFSIITLLLLDLPALYIIIASIIPALPLHEPLAKASVVTYMAAIAFGYGIPYTFLSGFETVIESDEADKETETAEEPAVLEGGVEADLEDEEAPAEAEAVDEVVVDGVAADEEADTEEETPTETNTVDEVVVEGVAADEETEEKAVEETE